MNVVFLAGGGEVRPDERRLLVQGRAVALGARAFDLLLVLIAHHERVIGKEELLERVWPGIEVEENNLTVQISALRKVLGAGAISTVTGRGYRRFPRLCARLGLVDFWLATDRWPDCASETPYDFKLECGTAQDTKRETFDF